jgi:hypothetical protein
MNTPRFAHPKSSCQWRIVLLSAGAGVVVFSAIHVEVMQWEWLLVCLLISAVVYRTAFVDKY